MGRGRMVDVVVSHRADEGKLIHPLCQLRQMLADLNTWNLGIDRLEFAPVLSRCLGLGIPRILLGRATSHEEKNTRFGWLPPLRLMDDLALGLQQCWQGQT
jgi:hypothetical protein